MSTWLIAGASGGIGLEFVRQLLAQGHQVIATVQEETKASELWTLAGSAGGACRLLLCNVEREAGIVVESAGY